MEVASGLAAVVVVAGRLVVGKAPYLVLASVAEASSAIDLEWVVEPAASLAAFEAPVVAWVAKYLENGSLDSQGLHNSWERSVIYCVWIYYCCVLYSSLKYILHQFLASDFGNRHHYHNLSHLYDVVHAHALDGLGNVGTVDDDADDWSGVLCYLYIPLTVSVELWIDTYHRDCDADEHSSDSYFHDAPFVDVDDSFGIWTHFADYHIGSAAIVGPYVGCRRAVPC